MNCQELEAATQKAILENQHNLTAPVVVQIWKTRKLCRFPAKPLAGFFDGSLSLCRSEKDLEDRRKNSCHPPSS